MPVSAETLRLLMDAGIEGEQLLAIVQSIDEAPKPRSANAERQARFRARKKAQSVTNNVTSNVTDNVTPRAHVEDNLKTKNLTGQEENKKAAPKALSDLDAFRADLARDCSPEQVDAFVKHRKSKKGQNSAYSARLFRRDAEACGLSVSQAIDTAISRGWLTVKPEYLAIAKRKDSQATGPPRKPNAFDAYEEIAREKGWITDEPNVIPSPNGHDQRFPAERGEPQGTVVDLRPGAFRRIRSGDM